MKVYALLQPSTRQIRYVGVTNLDVADRVRLHWLHTRKRDTPAGEWLKSLSSPPEHHVLQEVDDQHGRSAERYWIELLSQVSSVSLVNITGVPGRKPRRNPMTDETKRKLSLSRTGKSYIRTRTKLSDDEIRQIREATGTQREIAAWFGISQPMVHYIKTNKRRESLDR